MNRVSPGRRSDSRRNNEPPITATYDPPPPPPATELTPNPVPVGQAVGAPATPATRADEIRAVPTISSLSAGTLHAAPVNEVNLIICPIRDPPAAAVVAAQAVVAGATVPPDIANCNAAFFTEAATGSEADTATGAVRRLILALITLAVGSAPPASYFPSGINSLIKQVDGRTRRHTGLYTLRVLRSLAANLTNIISSFFAISAPEDQAVPTTIANYVLRVPKEPAMMVVTHLSPATLHRRRLKVGYGNRVGGCVGSCPSLK